MTEEKELPGREGVIGREGVTGRGRSYDRCEPDICRWENAGRKKRLAQSGGAEGGAEGAEMTAMRE